MVVVFTDSHVGQNALSIGDGHRVGMNVLADDVANLPQRIAVDLAEKRQRFVGNIQRQLGLASGAGLFFTFNALHKQYNKADTDAAGNHWNTDFGDDIHP